MNKYEILENIGEGQFGVVLKALNKQTEQLVAIKKFKEDDSQPENKRVILREVKILKTLNHQNVIQLKQAFRRKGKIYLVCEYVQKNLLQILQETPLSPNRVKNFAFQLLKGIAYMHNLNILHRDIKPENLLISKSDKVKICDLGFARTIPNTGKMTDYVATRWYRPPELLIGKDSYDKSIDIWSVGCVMAEMIDGEPLFGGQNDLDQLYLIQKCLGSLISNHKQFFLKNPKFVGMKFPQIHAIQSIDRRYFGKIDKTGLDLLKKMLKMDPQARITAQQALNHPYFSRLATPIERQAKKSSIIEGKNSTMQRDERQQSINKSHLYVNNFLQDKGFKNSKDDKVGVNKVTGVSKGQKYVIPHNNIDEGQGSWVYSGKGKSLGKKPNAQKVRDKEKYSKVKGIKERKLKNEEDEYAQEWQQDEEEKKTFYVQKTDRRMQNMNGKVDQKSLQKKKMKKIFKKDNVNIVFNQNTYNLNIIDQPNH